MEFLNHPIVIPLLILVLNILSRKYIEPILPDIQTIKGSFVSLKVFMVKFYHKFMSYVMPFIAIISTTYGYYDGSINIHMSLVIIADILMFLIMYANYRMNTQKKLDSLSNQTPS